MQLKDRQAEATPTIEEKEFPYPGIPATDDGTNMVVWGESASSNPISPSTPKSRRAVTAASSG